MNTSIPTARPTAGFLSKETKDLEDEVKTLQEEANRPRMKTSEAIKDILKFIEDHKDEDHLTKGMPPPQNPFLEKHGGCCALL